MKLVLMLVAVQAAAVLTSPPSTPSTPSAPPSLPTNSKTCIDHCTCSFGMLTNRLQVTKCDRPLVLNDATFKYISKTSTNVITLDNLIINQIQVSAFAGFKNLDDVIITNTRIATIDVKAFENVTRLKFSKCAFEDSPDLFSTKLEEVHFGECKLEEIPNLNGLINLTFLNLSGNYIKNIEVEAFAELFDLGELHLSDNNIHKLPPTAFINNQELITLNLDNNPLKHFNINTSDSLEILSLKNCQLETFDEESTKKLTSLNELNLSHNNLTDIFSKALSHMQDLSVIDLSYNKLTKLQDNIFSGNGKLIKVILDGNNFDTLPSFYRQNHESFSTYTFSCKSCNLRILSANVFQNMDGLINLELSHNKLMNVDNVFDKITSLKQLDISYNEISYLSPAAFVHNGNLEILNIAGNPLLVLNPEVFAANHLLRDIDARNATLTKLWSNYNKPVKSLHKLLLSGNFLGTLTNDDFNIMPKLEAIELEDNPLVFDEKLCMLLYFLDLQGITPIDYSKNIYTGADKAFREDIDDFVTIEWKDVHKGKCPEHITESALPELTRIDNKTTYKTIDKIEKEDYEEDDDDDDSDSDEYDDEYYDEETTTKFQDTSLARATYILSVTSVFVLSALVVLTIAVTLTLCILRRNNRFDMQRANLPRLKIPLWNTTPGQKKHSGSVYRPLSEDLSGPKTPKLSRYEFNTTPVVHTA